MITQERFFKRYPRLTILLVNLVLVFVVLLGFEVGLRIFPPSWLSARMAFLRAGGNVRAEVGTDTGWKIVNKNGKFLSFVPNSKFDVLHREYQNRAEIDECGGRKVVPERDSTELVPFLGDSFTFGIGVENDQTFVSLLQSAISFRLLNLGVAGSALPGQRFIVENRHEDLKSPRLYVFCFFLGNDFEDIYKYYHAPASPTAKQNHQTRIENHAWLKGINRFVVKSALRYSYFVQFVRQPILQQVNKRASVEMMDPIFLMMNQDRLEYHATVRSCLQLEINSLQELSQKVGFRFLIVLIPDKYQVCPELAKPKAQYYGLDFARLDAVAPNAMLIRILKEHRIEYIDPTKAFQGAPKNERFYYVSDNHFTVEGHRFFADAIRPQLQAKINEVMGGNNVSRAEAVK